MPMDASRASRPHKQSGANSFHDDPGPFDNFRCNDNRNGFSALGRLQGQTWSKPPYQAGFTESVMGKTPHSIQASRRIIFFIMDENRNNCPVSVLPLGHHLAQERHQCGIGKVKHHCAAKKNDQWSIFDQRIHADKFGILVAIVPAAYRIVTDLIGPGKKSGRIWKLGISVMLLGILTGCGVGGYYGNGYGGLGYDDYYGADLSGDYGGYWGPDGYVFGHHLHGGLDHDFGQRGFTSRSAVGFHGGGGFAHAGGGFHGGGGHGGGRRPRQMMARSFLIL